MSVNGYLLKDIEIVFTRGYVTGQSHVLTSEITISPEDFSTCDSKLSWNLCHQLRQSIAGLDVKQRQLKIKCVSTGTNIKQKSICLEGTCINHLVDEIGADMKLEVIYHHLPSTYCLVLQPEIEFCTAGMVPHYSYNDRILMYEGSIFNAPENWPQQYGPTMRGKLTITMYGVPKKASKKLLTIPDVSMKAEQSKNLTLFTNKIFTEQFDTDVEIVSRNGCKHPCHKIFLTGNSPVFQAMFKGESFREGQANTVTLENISEKGVVALLNYLYCIDSNEVETQYDSEICMELLEASEEYLMSNLQKSIKHVFLNKSCDWFQVDTALQLFCFSRSAENCQELVDKCIQVLKLKHGEMRDSDDYKKLFKKNPEAAMDLCYLLSK